MSRFHPIFRIFACLSILLTAMFVTSPVISLISLCGVLLSFLFNDGVWIFLKKLGFSVLTTLIVTAVNPIFSHRGATPLFFLNGKPFTLEALTYGFTMGITLTAAILSLSLLDRLVDRSEILSVFGRFSPNIALVISMTFGFIPKIRQKFHDISQAQKGSGALPQNSPADRLLSDLRVFTAVTSWVIENAAETAASMKSRGYGKAHRSYFDRRKLTPCDVIFTVLSVTLTLTVLILCGTGHGQWNFYPVISHSGRQSATVISAAIISFAPPFIIGKEKLKWKFLLAKI
jgi:energy-coupling factor transport system permease protein